MAVVRIATSIRTRCYISARLINPIINLELDCIFGKPMNRRLTRVVLDKGPLNRFCCCCCNLHKMSRTHHNKCKCLMALRYLSDWIFAKNTRLAILTPADIGADEHCAPNTLNMCTECTWRDVQFINKQQLDSLLHTSCNLCANKNYKRTPSKHMAQLAL